MKLMLMADLVSMFLCPQNVSNFEPEIGAMADLVFVILWPQPVSDFEHGIGVNG